MAFPIIMPRQGQSVESCIIAKWFKKKGDAVAIGDPLFSYETDKAAFDEESKVAGTILEIFANEGDDVPVLTNVCVIGNPGEDISAFAPAGSASSGAAAIVSSSAAPVAAATPLSSAAPAAVAPAASHAAPATGSAEGPLAISPRAKNLAERSNVDYRFAEGTGPHGRVIERDIESLKAHGSLVTSAARDALGDARVAGSGLGGRITTADLASIASTAASATGSRAIVAGGSTQAAAGTDYEEVKITNIRKVIAKAMFASISTTCQLTLNASFDASEIMAFRKKIKENKDALGLENITLNDIVVYSVSRTLLAHRDLNAHFKR